MKSAFLFGLSGLVFLVAACTSTGTSVPQTLDGGGGDGGGCGDPIVGSTCKKPSGECEALTCVGTAWGCPKGDTEVALTAVAVVPGSCEIADVGTD